MKVYAKQVSPEYQESPLFLGNEFFPDNIAVFGNRDYIEHCPEVFERVYTVLSVGELAEVLEDRNGWKDWYKNITEAITDYLPPEKAKYSTKDIGALKKLVLQYAECSSSEEDSILCAVLSVVTGQEWNCKIISGCCQSDWNYMYYPVANWSREALKVFEIEYFNTGSEWIIDDGEFDPENDSPLNINGCSVYCTSWSDEGIRKEIADAEGVDPADVVLYAFEGWSRTAQYKEVV